MGTSNKNCQFRYATLLTSAGKASPELNGAGSRRDEMLAYTHGTNTVPSRRKIETSEWAAVPMIECDRYTITSKESISVRGYSTDSISIAIKGPGIKNQKSLTTDKKGNLYTTCFRPTQKGEYKITATTQSGKTAEARIFVRQPWSWYMKMPETS